MDHFEARLTLSNSISDKLININKKSIKNYVEQITPKIYHRNESEKKYNKNYSYNNILFNFNREKRNGDIKNKNNINSYIYYNDTK